jgi:hypothetical protein
MTVPTGAASLMERRTRPTAKPRGRRDAAFRYRDFSDRTLEALVAAGIDAPERLLFMSATAVKAICRRWPGIACRDRALPLAVCCGQRCGFGSGAA